MDPTLLSELQALIVRHAGAEQIRRPLPGLVVAVSSQATPLASYVTEPVFSLVAQGAKRLVLADRTFDYGAGQYLMAPVDLPVSGHVSMAAEDRPFLGVSLVLKPEVIASLMLDAGMQRTTPESSSGIAISTASNEVLEPLVRLLRLLDRPADLPVLAPTIEREIFWRLMHGEQGAMLRQLGLADGSLGQVSRAIRWIREHLAETFQIEDLAGRVGMSPTSFHRHFRRVTSMSPIQFQKRIRLQEAHAMLQTSSKDVASIGFAVGYGSPSQFSREYRRLFGMAPGQQRQAG